ncbi:sigma 54-interacting transcriptional regulator [Bacteroidota bacterium]
MLTFLYIFTGISLGFAIVSLILGFQKQTDKVYVTFGVIGLCTSIYYLLFPYMEDPQTSVALQVTGILAILIAFGLLPWFFSYYSGFKNRYGLWAITFLLFADFILFLLSVWDIIPGLYWLIVSHIALIGIIVYCFLAILHMRKKVTEGSEVFMWIILIPMSLLSIDDIILHYFPGIFGSSNHGGLLPLDFFPVFFMILMGSRMAKEIQVQAVMKKELVARNRMLDDILSRIHMLVIRADKDGIVQYTNPYFHELTGYSEEEVRNKHYAHFIPESIREESLERFRTGIENNTYDQEKRIIKSKNGDILHINWSGVSIFNRDEQPIGIITVGANVTDQMLALKEIESLKKELEKENIYLRTELGRISDDEEIIGKSEAFRYVIHRAKEVADTDAIVILEGETGVGKDLIARFIHNSSSRKAEPFISVNCAAIPKDLLESELFGYEKGAFTGAAGSKKGRVEQADNGTLFLDEIGDLPTDLQPKILRFIQESTFDRLGSEKSRHVSVRIITATNKNLKEEVEAGNFREDLYYRLHVYPITIPPLRKRRPDIDLLTTFFVDKYAKKYDRPITEISKSDKEYLHAYGWPGNVRELENVIESSVIGSQGKKLILARDLMQKIEKNISGPTPDTETLEEVERKHILYVLERCQWRISGEEGAAEKLGLHPNTLRSRMAKLKISKTFK